MWEVCDRKKMQKDARRETEVIGRGRRETEKEVEERQRKRCTGYRKRDAQETEKELQRKRSSLTTETNSLFILDQNGIPQLVKILLYAQSFSQ